MEKHNLKVVRCKGGSRHCTLRTNLLLYLRSFSVYPFFGKIYVTELQVGRRRPKLLWKESR